MGLIDGQFIANPSPAELDASDLNLTFAGTEASVLMLECVGKQVPEDTIAKVRWGCVGKEGAAGFFFGGGEWR